MQYLSIAIWFLVGIIIIVTMRKENKIFYLAGGYFVGLGIWKLLDVLMPEAKMSEGNLALGLKIVSGIVFVILFVFFLYNYRSNLRQNKEEQAAQAADMPQDGEKNSGEDEE